MNQSITLMSPAAFTLPAGVAVGAIIPRSAWRDVDSCDLRTAGDFLVSAKRSAGNTEWVRIKSLAGEPSRVRPNLPGEIRLMGDHAFKLQMLSPGTYQINLKQGEAVLLCPGTESSSQPVQPSSPRSQRNH